MESEGSTADWATRAATDGHLRERLVALDERVRAARTAESGGVDACASVGLAGQLDPLGIKCIHAHVALALIGLDDPIGQAVLAEGDVCPDSRCARLVSAQGDLDE